MTNDISLRIGWLLGAMLSITVVSTAMAQPFRPYEGTPGSSVVSDFTCKIDGVIGSFSQATSTYKVQGDCQVYQPHGATEFPDLIDVLNWEATGTYQLSNHNTAETILVRRASSTQFTAPVLVTIGVTMICGSDPWLQPDGLSCGSAKYSQTGTLIGTFPGSTASFDESSVVKSLYATNPVVPRSSMLSAQQRAALKHEYDMALANLQKQPNSILPSQPPPAKTVTPSNLASPNVAAALIAPTIMLPTANSHVGEGQFQVKGTINGTYTGNEGVYIEFTWLNSPAGQQRYVNMWPINLKQLLDGTAIPTYITRNQYGRWQARAQVMSPTQGPWGLPVPFYVDKIIVPQLNPNRPVVNQLKK